MQSDYKLLYVSLRILFVSVECTYGHLSMRPTGIHAHWMYKMYLAIEREGGAASKGEGASQVRSAEPVHETTA